MGVQKFSPRIKRLRVITRYQDVRWGDLTEIGSPLSYDLISTLWFNLDTRFGNFTEISRLILGKGKNPGLGVRSLHQKGITGKGVNVAIIDQNLCLHHPEYEGKIIEYKDVGCGQPAGRGSMHASGVLSLLAGNTIGTAPGVQVYFAAAPSWMGDARYMAEALEWIIEVNGSLPIESKIKVVSVSAAPSGKSTPFRKNKRLWDKAVEKAEREGLLVLDCTLHHGIVGPCSRNLEDPDNLRKCKTEFPYLSGWDRVLKKNILAPCTHRTTAEEYNDGHPGYQYCGPGGLSWAIPYVAGVLALGWQVRSEKTGFTTIFWKMCVIYVITTD